MDFRLVGDQDKCSGCRACQITCSEAHGHGFNPALSRMYVIKDDVAGCDIPITCHFCMDAACVDACPTQALTQSRNGWLALDEGICIACGACVAACPYDALQSNASSGTPLACDGCHGSPACVTACVTGALEMSS